jgi:hypothetical protein
MSIYGAVANYSSFYVFFQLNLYFCNEAASAIFHYVSPCMTHTVQYERFVLLMIWIYTMAGVKFPR